MKMKIHFSDDGGALDSITILTGSNDDALFYIMAFLRREYEVVEDEEPE